MVETTGGETLIVTQTGAGAKAQNELGDVGVVHETELGLGVDDGDSGVRSDAVEVRTDTTVARDRGLDGEAERRDGQGTVGVSVSVTQTVEGANARKRNRG